MKKNALEIAHKHTIHKQNSTSAKNGRICQTKRGAKKKDFAKKLHEKKRQSYLYRRARVNPAANANYYCAKKKEYVYRTQAESKANKQTNNFAQNVTNEKTPRGGGRGLREEDRVRRAEKPACTHSHSLAQLAQPKDIILKMVKALAFKM